MSEKVTARPTTLGEALDGSVLTLRTGEVVRLTGKWTAICWCRRQVIENGKARWSEIAAMDPGTPLAAAGAGGQG